jgi:hypothetical protein
VAAAWQSVRQPNSHRRSVRFIEMFELETAEWEERLGSIISARRVHGVCRVSFAQLAQSDHRRRTESTVRQYATGNLSLAWQREQLRGLVYSFLNEGAVCSRRSVLSPPAGDC